MTSLSANLARASFNRLKRSETHPLQCPLGELARKRGEIAELSIHSGLFDVGRRCDGGCDTAAGGEEIGVVREVVTYQI